MAKLIKLGEAAAVLGCDEKRAVARLAALGYTKECGRCGGSGHYSYNPIDGSVCFGCRGSGKALVKLTAELVAEAKARIEKGELAAYFARGAAVKALKGKVAAFNKVYSASGTAKAYDGGYKAASRAAGRLRHYPGLLGESAEGRAMSLLNAAHREVNDLDLNFRFPSKKGPKVDPVAAVARIEELTAFVAVLDAALAAYVAEHGSVVAELDALAA